ELAVGLGLRVAVGGAGRALRPGVALVALELRALGLLEVRELEAVVDHRRGVDRVLRSELHLLLLGSGRGRAGARSRDRGAAERDAERQERDDHCRRWPARTPGLHGETPLWVNVPAAP